VLPCSLFEHEYHVRIYSYNEYVTAEWEKECEGVAEALNPLRQGERGDVVSISEVIDDDTTEQ